VTRSFDPAHPGFTDGLFRPADHVLVVPQGSAIAILDLELGFVYATTPYGAESWSTLVGSARPPLRAVAETRSGPDDDEGSEAWPRIAGYLLDRRIIGPVAGGADIR
jgi:hypothetical protein